MFAKTGFRNMREVRAAHSAPKTPRLGREVSPGMPSELVELIDGESAEDDDRGDAESGGIVAKLRAQSRRVDDLITGDPHRRRSNHYSQSRLFPLHTVQRIVTANPFGY
jgi:hypothetical protein